MRANYWEENPPDDWEYCECCAGYHPSMPFPTKAEDLAAYDCRNDYNRWPSPAAIARLKRERPNG